MSYSNDQKKQKQKNNLKCIFFLSDIKIAQDYLRDSLKQFNTFGRQYGYTLTKPWQIIFHRALGMGGWQRSLDPELFPSPVKINEL